MNKDGLLAVSFHLLVSVTLCLFIVLFIIRIVNFVGSGSEQHCGTVNR